MKKVEFENLQMALEFAESNGGWIFSNEKTTIWYNAKFYGPTKIIYDSPGSGKIGPRSCFQ